MNIYVCTISKGGVSMDVNVEVQICCLWRDRNKKSVEGDGLAGDAE